MRKDNMDQTTFDVLHFREYTPLDFEFPFEPLSNKTWSAEDLMSSWGSPSKELLGTCFQIKPELSPFKNIDFGAVKLPLEMDQESGREHVGTIATSPVAKALKFENEQDIDLSIVKNENLNDELEDDKASESLNIQLMLDKIKQEVDDTPEDDSTAGENSRKRLCSWRTDVDLDLDLELLNNDDLENLDPHIASVPNSLWDDTLNSRSSLEILHDRQDLHVKQLLAHVKEIGETMDGFMPEPTKHCSSATASDKLSRHDSGLSSSGDDDDDEGEIEVEEENLENLMIFSDNEHDARNFENLMPTVIRAACDTDDEGEEVDILSVVEEVMSFGNDISTLNSKETFHVHCNESLVDVDKRLIASIQQVSDDHCYCPQVSNWVNTAAAQTFVDRQIAQPSGRHRAPGVILSRYDRCNAVKRKLPAKRGRKRKDHLRCTLGNRSRYFVHNTREKREQLNQMERERRVGLKVCFEKLRVVVPETSYNAKISKDKILLLAKLHIEYLNRTNIQYTQELAMQRQLNNTLRHKLKSQLVCSG